MIPIGRVDPENGQTIQLDRNWWSDYANASKWATTTFNSIGDAFHLLNDTPVLEYQYTKLLILLKLNHDVLVEI